MTHDTNDRPDIDAVFQDGRLIDQALKEAVEEALLQHKRAGNPIAIWKDGKVAWLPADKIPEPKHGA